MRLSSLLALASLFLPLQPGRGQENTALTEPMVAGENPYVPKDPRTEAFLRIEFKPELNTLLPLDLEFMGEDGQRTPLRARTLPGKPTLLALVYYRCPTMCNESLNGLVDSLSKISLKPGVDFNVLAVSFDPSETHVTAQGKKANALTMYGDPGSPGWSFLVGNAPEIETLTRSAGFGYKFDAVTNQFSHGSGLLVLTPEGRISRFLPGMDYPIMDLRLALVEAAEGKIGSLTDKLALLCYKYDPETNKYGLLIHRIILVACLATVASVAWLIIGLVRYERKHRTPPVDSAATPHSAISTPHSK